MKSYALLVFDWDGTLVDSESLVIEALQKTAATFNYPPLPTAEIHIHFGLNLELMFEKFFPEEDPAALSETFYQYFTEKQLATNFFQGALDTLAALKQQGFILAVATNRARAKLNTALATAKIEDLFATTRCPEDNAPKPAPDMLLSLLEELAISPRDALMIGDSIFDMQFAKNAHVDALAACYDKNRKAQLAAFNPVGFIENIQDLKQMVRICLPTV